MISLSVEERFKISNSRDIIYKELARVKQLDRKANYLRENPQVPQNF